MTVKEAIAKWSEACSVSKCGEALVRDGNWTPITRALRHFLADNAAEATEYGALNGDTVVLVTPAKAKPEEVPAPKNRPPFLLVVK